MNREIQQLLWTSIRTISVIIPPLVCWGPHSVCQHVFLFTPHPCTLHPCTCTGHHIQVGQVLMCLLTSVSNPKALGVNIDPANVNKSLVSCGDTYVASCVTEWSELIISGEGHSCNVWNEGMLDTSKKQMLTHLPRPSADKTWWCVYLQCHSARVVGSSQREWGNVHQLCSAVLLLSGCPHVTLSPMSNVHGRRN